MAARKARPKVLTVCIGDDRRERATAQYYSWFQHDPLVCGDGGSDATFTLPGNRYGSDVSAWVRAQLAAARAAGDGGDRHVQDILLMLIDAAFNAGAKHQAAKLKRLAAEKAAKTPATKRKLPKPVVRKPVARKSAMKKRKR